MYEVVYLTGAPAAGKSTTARLMAELVSPLEVFEFGERLTSHIERTRGGGVVQEDLRRRSSGLITPEDVAAVDRDLIAFAKEGRSRTHVVIDSHPVTKESFGFRVTPYSLADFAQLAPTQIWVLFADPETTMKRIGSNAQGRPAISAAEAAMHTHLQTSVAVTYGIGLGLPVHLFDTSRLDPGEVASMLAARLAGAR